MNNKDIVSAIFNCSKCNIEWEDLYAAKNEALRHTKKTNHLTTGHITITVTHKGKDKHDSKN